MPPLNHAPLEEAGSHSVRIDFHGPFRIGTGRPGPGSNEMVDEDDPLPASSLKGLMRWHARQLLPAADGLIGRVFGADRQQAAWYWDSADFPEQPRKRTRARIRVDSDSGTVQPGHLFIAEEFWASHAHFAVTPAQRLGETEQRDHLTLLACAAAAVHSLGADRRRGYGWVTCAPEQPTVDDELLTHFEKLRDREGGGDPCPR